MLPGYFGRMEHGARICQNTGILSFQRCAGDVIMLPAILFFEPHDYNVSERGLSSIGTKPTSVWLMFIHTDRVALIR